MPAPLLHCLCSGGLQPALPLPTPVIPNEVRYSAPSRAVYAMNLLFPCLVSHFRPSAVDCRPRTERYSLVRTSVPVALGVQTALSVENSLRNWIELRDVKIFTTR